MPSNEEIAKHLERIASEYDEEFKKDAYLRGAKVIREYNKQIVSGLQARKLKWIGPSISLSIQNFIDNVSEEKNENIQLFQNIHGVGKATAQKWYRSGYKNIEDLRSAPMNRSQKLGYKYYKDFLQRIDRCEIDVINNIFRERFNIKFAIAGSYRRGMPTSGDIDLLVEEGLSMDEILSLLSDLIVDSLTPKAKVKYMGVLRVSNIYGDTYPARRIDIRIISSKAWPYALLYFTGSKEFNIKMRKRAKLLGMLLSEYGLFENNKLIEVEEEKDIFNLLRVKYIPPERRDDKVTLEKIVNYPGKWYLLEETPIYLSDTGLNLNNPLVALFDSEQLSYSYLKLLSMTHTIVIFTDDEQIAELANIPLILISKKSMDIVNKLLPNINIKLSTYNNNRIN